jgi:hypothetical protein
MFKKLMEKIMAKKKKEFLQEIAPVGEEEVDEIAEKVAKEELKFEDDEEPEAPEPQDAKMNKGDYLDSIGLGERPGSQLAATKWEEYLGI